jgi:hypothetical protein
VVTGDAVHRPRDQQAEERDGVLRQPPGDAEVEQRGDRRLHEQVATVQATVEDAGSAPSRKRPCRCDDLVRVDTGVLDAADVVNTNPDSRSMTSTRADERRCGQTLQR